MAHRIYIEDAEQNFLYLDVANVFADSLVTTINAATNGKAKIERRLDEHEQEELLAVLGPPRRFPEEEEAPFPDVEPWDGTIRPGNVCAVRRFPRPSSSSVRSAARKRGR